MHNKTTKNIKQTKMQADKVQAPKELEDAVATVRIFSGITNPSFVIPRRAFIPTLNSLSKINVPTPQCQMVVDGALGYSGIEVNMSSRNSDIQTQLIAWQGIVALVHSNNTIEYYSDPTDSVEQILKQYAKQQCPTVAQHL